MEQYHGTTILSVRRGNRVALGGDGQVTLGNIVVKASARKVRAIYSGKILAGFAGGTADAFTLFERFEAKLEKHQGNLLRSAVELAKDWRTDRMLRRLEAMLAVADRDTTDTSVPSLTKRGAGTWILAGTYNVQNSIGVEEGKLSVSGSIAAAPSTFIVNGATLEAAATQTMRNVNVAPGAKLQIADGQPASVPPGTW